MPQLRVAVIIPAYCEERLIAKTISGVPAFVEEIIVVDDGSDDRTTLRAQNTRDPRVIVITHAKNQGVGAAIYTGYRRALRGGADAFVVMAGDNQMDAQELPALVAPLSDGGVDYVKGDRLAHECAADMPRLRRYGTAMLAVFTSAAAGVSLADSQCGYTAISRRAARSLDWSNLWPGYGYPNDLLIFLARRGARIGEVPVRPVYADEESGLRFWHFVMIFALIFRRIALDIYRPRQDAKLNEAPSARSFAPRADGG